MNQIIINYDDHLLRGTQDLLAASPLKSLISPGMKAAIKPNLVLAQPPSDGATTHSEIVEGLIRYLHDCGINNIEIIESSWIGGNTKQAWQVCDYERLRKQYGVVLHDLKDDRLVKIKSGKYEMEICRRAVDTDFLINVPVLKAHCQTRLTCNMKNLKGCISDREKRRFHTMGLHGPIAYLNQAIQTHFCLVDGICGDLTFEEGGNPVTRNMLLAGTDPLLLDSYCAGLIGCQIEEIEYLRIGAAIGIGSLYGTDSSYGIGSLYKEAAPADDNSLLILNQDRKPVMQPTASGLAARLARYIREDQACSACYSALIYALHQVDPHIRETLPDKINIGQGFKGKTGEIGCGNCTAGHSVFVRGCPPKAVELVSFLRKGF